jgi:hypothetical protein
MEPSGTYRPSRAKVKLEDIDNIAPESLWGSKLTFTDRFGDSQILLADPSYNVDGDTVYIPGRYKIQRTAGIGTEGFNRDVTVENLRKEAGRFLNTLVKSSTYTGPGDERFVNLFTRQFSPTGDELSLAFTNPNPGPDLIDITGFSGGSVGFAEGLVGDLGTSVAQQFELSEPGSVSFLELHLHRIGDPVGSISASIHEDNAGKPGNLIESAEGVLARKIPSGIPKYTVFRMFTPVALDASTPYWIVVSGNETYSNGIPLYRSGFDEQFPPFQSYALNFGNPTWTWIGAEAGNGGVTPNERSITVEAPPGHEQGVILANPLNLFDFTNYELLLTLSNQVASGGLFPTASGAVYIQWYDDALTFLGRTAVSLTNPNNDSLVIDMAGPLFDPLPGATKFGFLFSAFTNTGAFTLEEIEIREKNTLSLPPGPENQIVWTKETGGYSYPRAKTTADLVPVNGTRWVTNAGEHHYFKVIGS